MLNAISPYVGFTAAGLVLVILAVDRHLRASRARALAVRIAVGGPHPRSHRADITQRLPVVLDRARLRELHHAPGQRMHFTAV